MRCQWVLRLSVAILAIGTIMAQMDAPAFESAMSSFLTIWNSVVSSLEAIPTAEPSTSTSSSTASTSISSPSQSGTLLLTIPSMASFPSTIAASTTFSSVLSTSTTSSSTSGSTSDSTSITSAARSSSTMATISSSTLPVSTAQSSTMSSPNTTGSGTALSSRTRNIIIGVTVPLGIIILAAIILLLVVCCRRRRRHRRQRLDTEPKFEETQFIGNGDWEHGDYSHHGFGNTMGASVGSRNDPRSGVHSDVTPLMESNRAVEERTADPRDLPYPDATANSSRPVSINRPITRKPVPNRTSDGSTISSISAPQRNSHNGVLLGAGAGALAGVVATHHHHNNNRYSRPSPQPEHYRGSPTLQSGNRYDSHSFDNAREDYFHWQPTKPSPPPFSPDDVGSNYRKSQRFSQGPVPAESSTLRNSAPISGTGIAAPTVDQRRSLQNRHSGSSDSQDRRTSPGPRRRSLSGGGEVWQADSMFMPALSSEKRDSGGGRQYVSSPTAPPLPSQRKRTSSGSQTPLLTPPAAPYNRHLANARAITAHNKTYGSNTDSSTSGDSWESAQAEITNWDDTDPGRYPRLDNSLPTSRVPLIPPRPVWQDGGQRRWSDEAPPAKNSYSRPSYQRYSSGSERRQRLRFDEGTPEFYNEAGLVGRAL